MTRTQKQYLVVAGLMILAAVLRFWAIGSRPGYEWDEPVYTNIATHLAHFGVLQVKPDVGSPIEPYVYHPPFYFLMLAGWFKLVGAGITSARVLSGLMSLVFLTLAYLFMRWYLDGKAALVPLVLLVTDGWLVYCNRISWMENTLLVIVIAAIWMYATAIDTGSRKRFLTAGLLIGSATVFKHVGGYLIPVVLLHWLIVRRHNRQHMQMFCVVGAVIVCYALGMAAVFGHDYWHEVTVQFERTFGNHDNRGTVNSLSGLIKPTIDQYYIFYATIFLALSGVATVVFRALQIVRQRSFEVVRLDSLLFAWAFGSLFSFGVINLKFPQYSVLVLVPLYLYLSVEAIEFVRSRTVRVRAVACVVLAAIVAFNGLTYVQRISSRNDNALAAVGRYAEAYMQPDSLTITEEAVGDVIPQPYCKLYHVQLCKPYAKYVIIYRSFTERPPKQPGLERLVDRSTLLARFTGFKEKISVYEVKGSK